MEIKISVFNDICGYFEDNVNILVKGKFFFLYKIYLSFLLLGLPKKTFPTRINIEGSPVILTPN